MNNIIEISNLNKKFGEGNNEVHILKDINLSIKSGDFIAIIGASGSGKSTLMNILGCLDTASNGSYKIDGEEASNMDSDGLAALRRKKFGFIFQRYNLLSTLTAIENVALPAVYSGVPQSEREDRAKKILSDLGLEDKIKNKPHELSGGQQQRVSIGRALMNGGEIILADEPTGALDSHSGEMVMGIIKELHEKGHTIILVTHDKNIANYANRIIEIKDGEIISDTSKSSHYSLVKKETIKEKNSFSFFKDQLVESFKMALNAISAHKLRSFLTMLGIIIGIASVVSIVALGNGSQQKILSDISSMGTNTIDIYPGEGFGDMRSGKVKTLTANDSQVLNRQSYVDSSTPNSSTSGALTYKNIAVNAQVKGVGYEFFDVKGIDIAKGNKFYQKDIKNSSQVAVIDKNTQNELFPNGEDPIGKILFINKKPLKIIGVSQEKKSAFGNDDNLNIWAPYTTVMNRISGSKNIDSITVKVKDNVSMQAAEKSIIDLLTVKHGGKKDFFTMNTDSIKQTVESTTNTMTLLISSIAVIALIVGGIGVMNIMLVSVTERTKEIGVRMAIGAREYNILQQFLIEAILICLIGGAAGIALSYGISILFNNIVTNFAMTFSTMSIIMAVVCSTMIGIIFGFMPARNASKLNPITALSRE
ncbi:MacB family efflux pump subunit [Shigella flexneri]